MFNYEPMPENYRQNLIRELEWMNRYSPIPKDILIVVHNQKQMVEKCIQSVIANTSEPYNLYIWDNASDPETRDYLRSLKSKILVSSSDNIGFIEPNNFLAVLGKSPYIILLNSDTVVSNGWDQALIGTLLCNHDFAIVGYQGGILDDNCNGVKAAWGEDIDYVQGWCLCLNRHFYRRYGLFDDVNLKFAYGEDSDLSLRAKQASYKVYALHLDFVQHVGGATIKEVQKLRDTSATYASNHGYLKVRWERYLKNGKKKG